MSSFRLLLSPPDVGSGLLAAIQWRGGDPTALAWTCALAYLAAGIACLVVAKRHWAVRSRGPTDAGVWLSLGGLLVLLGVNKEADLQTILVHLGRDGAHALGLYPYKYYIGAAFFVAVTLLGATGLWRSRQRLREFVDAHPFALGGLAFIGLYTLVRFAAIVHLGPAWFVGLEEVAAFVALEIVGSGLILGAAIRALQAEVTGTGANRSG